MGLMGGEVIARMLKEEGVDTVFGIPDGTYHGLYTILRDFGIRLITPRHESAGMHAAGAYAKASGKLGVCIASNGPGVAAVLSGVAVENTEGHRVLLITSSRRPSIIYPDRGGAYQVFDHVGVISPMSKYSEPVSEEGRLIEIMRQGFRKCYTGRPGVVHIDVPESIINNKTKFEVENIVPPSKYRRVSPIYPADEQVEKAAELLSKAKFPIIHAGAGVLHAGAREELAVVANLLHSPTTTSWAGRGALCESNSLSIPMTAMELAQDVRREADTILILGSRMGETDWWGKAPYWGDASQKVIQVDIDDEYIGRNKPIELGILSDIKVFLRKLHDKLKEKENAINKTERENTYKNFLDKAAKVRAKIDEHLNDLAAPINTAHLADQCQKIFPKNSIAVFDGGNTAVWGQFFYKCGGDVPGIGTPKMGMLGAGVGQALGAAAAFPERQVYCVIGDGAFGYHPQEVETAMRNKMNITFVVACDRQWGMVKINQQFKMKPIKTVLKRDFAEDEVVNTDFGEVLWDEVALAMGAQGYRAHNLDELKEFLRYSAHDKGCKVIHVMVDPKKHLWAPGLQTFKKVHEEPKGK